MLVKKELLEIDRCNFQRIYKWIQQLIVKKLSMLQQQ